MNSINKTTAISFIALTLSFGIGIGCSKTNSDKGDSNVQATAQSSSTPKSGKATIMFIGDAMTHQAQIDKAKQLGGGDSYDFTDCFKLIAPDVKAVDYAVVNLEVPLGGGKGGYTGYPTFSAPDSYAVALKDAGFDLFLTANNHMLDRSDYGLRRTITALDSLNIPHVGVYNNAQDRVAKVPYIADINGIKVAFLNYTYGTNGLTAKDGAEVSYIDRDAIKKEIKASRDAGAELVAVCIHWGNEYQLHEHATQRDLADFMLAEEVDMIIGGHPHVVQPMVIKETPSGKKVPVVYSLGNFISNMTTKDTQGGALVYVDISRDANGKAKVDGMSYDTFYAAKPDPKAKPGSAFRNFTVVPSRLVNDSLPAAQKGGWTTFNTRAEDLFKSSNVGVSHR